MEALPNRKKFLGYNIGHMQQWPIAIPVSDMGREFASQWVHIEDGKRLTLYDGNVSVPIIFEKKAEEREARDWLKKLGRRSLFRLEDATNSTLEFRSRLTFMRTSSTIDLAIAPSIILSPDLLAKLKNLDPKRKIAHETLGKQSWLQTYSQSAILFTTNILSIDGTVANENVSIYLSNRKKIECKVCGEVGREWLEAVEIENCAPSILDGRLARIPSAPKFVCNVEDVSPTDLQGLRPQIHPFLSTWVAYENEAIKRANVEYTKRRKTNLEYDSVAQQDADNIYLVRLINSELELSKWTKESKPLEVKSLENIRAEVEIHGLTNQATEPIPAELQSFAQQPDTNSFSCKLLVRKKFSLPPKGRIVAVHSGGQVHQLKRRAESLQRLRRGGSACPEMLEIISTPSAVEPVIPAQQYKPHSDSKPLNEKQKEAIKAGITEPSLYLVQGPPGTGKTSVIVELIRQLRKKYRNRKQADGGALRVLVTSVQNDAVVNAIEKLSSDNVEVYSDFGSSVGKQAERSKAYRHSFIKKAEQIAENLWNKHRGSGAIQAIRRLSRLKEEFTIVNSQITIGGFDLNSATKLVAVIQDDCFEALPNNLKKDAREFAEILTKKIDSQRGSSAKPINEPDSIVTTLTDLSKYSSVLDSAQAVIEIVDNSFSIDELSGLAVNDIEVAERWRSLATKLRRAIRRKSIDEKCLKTWQDLRDESNSLVARQNSEEPVNQFFQLQSSAATELIDRVRVNLETLWDSVGNDESAVLVDWIRRLSEEPACLEEVFQNHAPVLTASCQRSGQPRRHTEEDYDIVIVDEAARAGIDILIPMNMGKSVILVGDQNQLPPHVEESVFESLERDADVDLKTESFFQWMWDRLPVANRVMLDTQYRMHEEIGRIVSKCFYKGKLNSFWTAEKSSREKRIPDLSIAKDFPISWIDTSDVLTETELRRKYKLPKSDFNETNPLEIQLVLSVLENCDYRSLKGWAERSDNGKAVGILSFYKKQIGEIENALNRLPPKVAELIECGTVNSFQGKEYPLVLLSTVRSNESGKIGFLKVPQMVNVAISRAQIQLVMIGDAVTLYRANLGKKSPGEMHPLQRVYHRIEKEFGAQRIIPSRRILDAK